MGPPDGPRLSSILLVLLPLLPALVQLYRLLERHGPGFSGGLPLLDHDGEPIHLHRELFASGVLAVMGYFATLFVTPTFLPFLLKRGLFGKDLCKKGMNDADKPVPEATGVIPGTVFLVCIILLQCFFGTSQEKMIDYHSALLSICFMIFLGFTDDVLDLPWRYKLLLPSIATLPLLCAYDGSTQIVVPSPLKPLLYSTDLGGLTALGSLVAQVFPITLPALTGVTLDGGLRVVVGAMLLDLGLMYMVYMGMLAVFCTNAVNIYAGINGLEAGQAFIIGAAILFHNFTEITLSHGVNEHLFSAMLIMPFLGCTIGLLHFNWFPAKAFVGDTFCYFSGMTFAVLGIHGHFSKTLLLLFIPQVLNFLLSVPQLFKYVPCPRHRLPRINTQTGLLEPSSFECDRLQIFKSPQVKGHIINLTLINLVLKVCGPMKERTLCTALLVLQAASCGLGFWVRYRFSALIYDA